MKHGKCPLNHTGPLVTMQDGRGWLCPCAGGALYDSKPNGALIGPKSLVDLIRGLDRMIEDISK